MVKECSCRQDELTEQERKRLECFGSAIDRLTLMDNVFLARFFQDNLFKRSFICLQKILDRDDVYASEAHIIYVNSAKQDDTALGKLMHDFTCAEPKEMYYPEMKEKAYVLKYEQKERGKMAGVMEELIAEERKKQREEQNRLFAIVLLQDGTFSIEKIAHMVKLDIAEVEALAKEVQKEE